MKMELVKCANPECGESVSHSDDFCPYCGTQLPTLWRSNLAKNFVITGLAAIIVLILFGVGALKSIFLVLLIAFIGFFVFMKMG